MVLFYVTISLICIFGIIGLFYTTNYNRLNNKKIKINEAEYSIDESLRVRYDLIVRVSNIIKTTIDINAEYFKEFENLKSKKISNFDLDRKIKEAINLVMQLKNDYPALEENRGFKDVLAELRLSEEKLEAAKAFYNKYTAELNTIIKNFPSNIVARFHRFEIKPFFDGKNMEDDIINDFKL